MKHGYTNTTSLSRRAVIKTYAGPDAAQRQSTEEHALRVLAGRIPAPRVSSSEPGTLTTSYVEGTHGQELLDLSPALVLAACGRLLASLHAVPVEDVFPGASSDAVVVHGDFGPNNVLLSGTERPTHSTPPDEPLKREPPSRNRNRHNLSGTPDKQ